MEVLENNDLKKIMSWHNKHTRGKPCVVCDSRDFAPLPVFTTRVRFDREVDRHIHSSVLLSAEVLCKNCGFIYTYHAKKIGFGTKSAPNSDDKKFGGSDK